MRLARSFRALAAALAALVAGASASRQAGAPVLGVGLVRGATPALALRDCSVLEKRFDSS